MTTSQPPTDTSKRQFIKYGVAGVVGFGVASAIEIPILNNSLQNDNSTINKQNTQINQLNAQNSSLQSQLSSAQQIEGFLTLNPVTELPAVEALAETIIPTDATGPGAKEAGVAYFIDRMPSRKLRKSRQYVHARTFHTSPTNRNKPHNSGRRLPKHPKNRDYIHRRNNCPQAWRWHSLPICI